MSERIHVELGCGNNRRDIDGWENIGVDVIPGEHVDVVCNLGFQEMNIENNSVDFVQAIDLFEHVPKCVWASEMVNDSERSDNKWGFQYMKKVEVRLTPLIFLMNDIYRILKPNGILRTEIPFSDYTFSRDPTHVSRYSDDWFHYFKQEDNLYADQGLVTCNFMPRKNEFKAWRNPDDFLITELVAIK